MANKEDEKIDRIDKRLSELVTITGNLVMVTRGLNDKYESLETKVDLLIGEQQKTNKRLDRNSILLDEALARIIELQKGQNQTVPQVENLAARVEIIEEKLAA